MNAYRKRKAIGRVQLLAAQCEAHMREAHSCHKDEMPGAASNNEHFANVISSEAFEMSKAHVTLSTVKPPSDLRTRLREVSLP